MRNETIEKIMAIFLTVYSFWAGYTIRGIFKQKKIERVQTDNEILLEQLKDADRQVIAANSRIDKLEDDLSDSMRIED